MAKNCSLCGVKLGFRYNSRTPNNIPICDNCDVDYINVLTSAMNDTNFNEVLDSFKEKYKDFSDVVYCADYFTRVNKLQKGVSSADTVETETASKNESSNYDMYGPFTDKPYVYSIEGVRGRHIDIYNDKVVITTKVTLGSILTHNATDGEKTIYFSDCIGVQYKKSTFTIGYLQFETASSGGNNAASNFFHENSFTFDLTVVSNEKMEEVAAFVKGRIDEIKRAANAPVQAAPAAAPVAQNLIADELLKLKQLVDMGVLTQEEFDMQKKKLLGL